MADFDATHDTERALIGACLLDSDAIYEVTDIVTPDTFLGEAHQLIWSALLSLAEESRKADLVTVTDQLREDGKLQRVGGSSYLIELFSENWDVANVRSYAEILRREYLRRKITRFLNTAQSFASSDPLEALDKMQAGLMKIGDDTVAERVTPIGEAAASVAQYSISHSRDRKPMRGIKSGYELLDDCIARFEPGSMTLLAARPSVGKTAFALQLALRAARNGSPVYFASLEMSTVQLTQRLLASTAYVNLAAIRSCCLSDVHQDQVQIAADNLRELPLVIDDSADLTPLDLLSRARRMKNRGGLELVIIDYIGLLESRAQGNRVEQVTEISRRVKAMAKTLDVPVIALSQLSRGGDDGRPLLRHLRDSGALEQDADIVLFLHQQNGSKENLELTVAKNRQGATRTFPVTFSPEHGLFDVKEWRF